MQFARGSSDRQTVDAVQILLDRTYALVLELTDAGVDFPGALRVPRQVGGRLGGAVVA
jgi:hypothetical protein